MKIKITYLSILVFNLLLVKQTTAQVLLTPDSLNVESGILKNFAPNFKNLLKHQFDKNFAINLPGTNPKARQLSSNEKFDIYTLPLDNMPCLVPNKIYQENMETMKKAFNKNNEQALSGKIPNLFKPKNLIPRHN